jgi:hypothetical protein
MVAIPITPAAPVTTATLPSSRMRSVIGGVPLFLRPFAGMARFCAQTWAWLTISFAARGEKWPRIFDTLSVFTGGRDHKPPFPRR